MLLRDGEAVLPRVARPRIAPALALTAAFALLVCAPAPGATRKPVRGHTPAARWANFSDRVAASWMGRQAFDGTYADVLAPPGAHSRYGESMLGYAMVQAGLRRGDRRLLNAGVRGVDAAVRENGFRRHGDAPFENLAIAAAYNVLRQRDPAQPRFRARRRAWEAYLESRTLLYLDESDVPDPERNGGRGYWNKWLVEAVAVLEMLRTGLASAEPGTILQNRADALRRVDDVVNRRIPAIAALQTVQNGRGDSVFVLSDPPTNPLAYHALSYGLLARAIVLLGRRASPAVRDVLRRMTDASWSLAGPDGDISYWGRSQEQAWAQAFTAYGAEVAAGRERVAARAARDRGVAVRVLDRLAAQYPLTPAGLALTPALGRDPITGREGLDSYAHMVDYNGLALVGLDWVISAAGGLRRPAGELAADQPGAAAVGWDASSFVAVRTPGLWYAVKRSRSAGPLRYDFGLVALKARAGTAWRDVLPLRPNGSASDTTGPILTVGTGTKAITATATGTDAHVAADGTVTVNGAFTDKAGGVARTATFTFRPSEQGVEMSWPGRAGDRYEVSAFFRGAPTSQLDGARRVLADGAHQVAIAPVGPAADSDSVALEAGYSSGADASLVRARDAFALTTDATVSVTWTGLP